MNKKIGYIQFQSENVDDKGTYTSNYFEDRKSFLDSLASGSKFVVYQKISDTQNEFKTLKELKIISVAPLNKEGKSTYLTFKAKYVESDSFFITGMINWE